jgi:hypothetical protein
MRRVSMNRLLSIFVAGAALTLFPGAVSAAPSSATGSWSDCNFGPHATSAGPNTVVTVGISEDYSGPVAGHFDGTERDVVYANGSATFHGSGTFSGTVLGRTGTGFLSYEGVFPTAGIIPGSGPGSAKWVLIGKTSELGSVRLSGTWGGTFLGISEDCDAGIFGGTYTADVVFAP